MKATSANQLFSFYRWRLLVAKHWTENRRRYGLSLLAIGGLHAIWFSCLIVVDVYAPMEAFMQFTAYIVGLYLVGCLYASMLFAELGAKKEALPWLSLPASHLEKLLCALLYGVVLFYIAYTLVFYFVDGIMVQWSNTIAYNHPRNWPNSNTRVLPVTLYNPFSAVGAPIPEKDDHLFTALYFTVQSVFLLGSVYFSRFSFIKTVVAVLLCAVGFIVFQKTFVFPLLPHGWNNNVLSWTQPLYYQGPPANKVRLPAGLGDSIATLIWFILPLFFWFVTFLRLKEKEV
ncbi:hypothetical protein [Puia sp.]|jgi:hypothetical protein|uniref:hypothetical protein n=1 Tax=Puia sp. TaxID=2045100 RepID=UPI002F420B9A